MTPIKAYEDIWERCNQLSRLHAYLANQVTAAVSLDDLLRSEWAMRVSALDLFVHELAAQNMRKIFEGLRPTTPAFRSFKISFEAMKRIRLCTTETEAASAFDLEVRTQFGFRTFQSPDDIASALRHCTEIELWNEVASSFGAKPSKRNEMASSIKKDLSLIIDRRNKIVHEGDLQPRIPRAAWTITIKDVAFVTTQLDRIVRTINTLV
jgi:hypothetical protein